MPDVTQQEIEAAAQAMADADRLAFLCATPTWEEMSEPRRSTLRRYAEAALLAAAQCRARASGQYPKRRRMNHTRRPTNG